VTEPRRATDGCWLLPSGWLFNFQGAVDGCVLVTERTRRRSVTIGGGRLAENQRH
jgi:hypothetical protein